MTSQLSPERLFGLGMGFWGAKALLSAVELDVFTRLAIRRATLAELTRDLGLHERGARDFFDGLVALGLLGREDGLYANAPDADLFLDRAKPSYVGGLLEMANAGFTRAGAN